MADTNNEATSPAYAALVVKGIQVGAPVPVDAELDPDSDNPVSNKAVSEKFDEIDEHLTEHENEYEETVYKVYMTSTVSGSYASGAVLGTFSNIPKGIYRVLQIGAVSQYGGYLAVVSGTVKSINSNGVESAAITAGYLHDYSTIKIESDTATFRITSPSALTYYSYYVMLEKKANVK